VPSPIKTKNPDPFHNVESEASMLNNVNIASIAPIRNEDSIKSKGQRISSGTNSSLEGKTMSFTRKIGECLGFKKLKSLKMRVSFGMGSAQEYDKTFIRNYVSTTKYVFRLKSLGLLKGCFRYNLVTWFPKSLMFQFLRIANIYFLIITILTAMPFSPKKPETMFLTFSVVLFLTMLKEGYEVHFS